MEFDEMKKIWDAQNNQPLYTFDEKTLHNYIQSKMKAVRRLTSMSEWSLIIFYLGAICILLGLNRFNPGAKIFAYLLAAWMFATVVYAVVSRIRRIKASRRFDRSLHGDLDHAISLENYQMRFSQIICWNYLPMGAIEIFSGWKSGKLLMASAVILVACTLAFYITSKGYRANKRRKRQFQILKEKLETSN